MTPCSVFSHFCSHPVAVPGHTKGGPNPDGPSSFPDCYHIHGCPCSAVPRAHSGQAVLGELCLPAVEVSCSPTDFSGETSGTVGEHGLSLWGCEFGVCSPAGEICLIQLPKSKIFIPSFCAVKIRELQLSLYLR